MAYNPINPQTAEELRAVKKSVAYNAINVAAGCAAGAVACQATQNLIEAYTPDVNPIIKTVGKIAIGYAAYDIGSSAAAAMQEDVVGMYLDLRNNARDVRKIRHEKKMKLEAHEIRKIEKDV